MASLNFNYNHSTYTIEELFGGRYVIAGNGVRILFDCEWKNGSYFKIKSVTKNGKTYQAQRYHYPYIQVVREATFEIYKNCGLYDYTNHKFHTYVKNEDMTMGKLIGRKLKLGSPV